MAQIFENESFVIFEGVNDQIFVQRKDPGWTTLKIIPQNGYEVAGANGACMTIVCDQEKACMEQDRISPWAVDVYPAKRA